MGQGRQRGYNCRTVGERLGRLREFRGLTREKMALAIGETVKQYRAVEDGSVKSSAHCSSGSVQ